MKLLSIIFWPLTIAALVFLVKTERRERLAEGNGR